MPKEIFGDSKFAFSINTIKFRRQQKRAEKPLCSFLICGCKNL